MVNVPSVQVRPIGTVMVKATVALKPPIGVIVIIEIPETPGFRLTAEGSAEMEKFGALVTVYTTMTE